MKQLKYVFMILISCISKAPCEDGIMSCMSGIFSQNTPRNAERPPQIAIQQDIAGKFELEFILFSGRTGVRAYPSADACLHALTSNPYKVLREAFPDLQLTDDQAPVYIFKNTGEKITETTQANIFQTGMNRIEVVLNTLQPRFRPQNLRLIVTKPFAWNAPEHELDFYNAKEEFYAFCQRNDLVDPQTGQPSSYKFLQFRIRDINLGTESTLLFSGSFKTGDQLVQWLSNNHNFVESALRQSFCPESLASCLQAMLIKSAPRPNNSWITGFYDEALGQKMGVFNTRVYRQFGGGVRMTEYGDFYISTPESNRRHDEFRELIIKIRPGNLNIRPVDVLAYHATLY